MSARVLLMTLATAAALLGCDIGGGSCPAPEPVMHFESGIYNAPGGYSEECSVGCSEGVFGPHDGVDDLELDLDLEGELVTIRYERDGAMVTERWTITSRISR